MKIQMKEVFISIDNVEFSTKEKCIAHELAKNLVFPCPDCKTKGYIYKEEYKVYCYFCLGNGYTLVSLKS